MDSSHFYIKKAESRLLFLQDKLNLEFIKIKE